MRQSERRRRPARTYSSRLNLKKAVFLLNVRARERSIDLHGSRCLKTLVALGIRHRALSTFGIVYAGTAQLGALGDQSRRSVQRSLPELLELGAIDLERSAGGRILVHGADGSDRPVPRAHGYALTEAFLKGDSPRPPAGPDPLYPTRERAPRRSLVAAWEVAAATGSPP